MTRRCCDHDKPYFPTILQVFLIRPGASETLPLTGVQKKATSNQALIRAESRFSRVTRKRISAMRLPNYPHAITPSVLAVSANPSIGSSTEPVVVNPFSQEPMGRDEVENAASKLLPVLHLINGEHFAGAERVQSHLGRSLPRFGIAADFACLKPGMFAKTLAAQNGAWGECYDAAMTHRADLSVVRRICKLIRRHDYQLLHAHTPRTAMIAGMASLLSRVPWIYHVHSPAARDSERVLTNRLNSLVEKASLRRCRHLITVSSSLKQDCVGRGVPASKITIVHNGVPTICPLREREPKAGGHWTLGMVALQRPRKGLEVALQSLALIRDHQRLPTGSSVRLRIVGKYVDQQYQQSIQNLISGMQLDDVIEQVGFTDDVPSQLARMDALVLPSLYGEGLPMVVLESMAAGVPVIATNVEGTPEVITDGVEGLLAEPNNADSLADAICALVTGQHDWQRMSLAAKLRHERDFSDEAMAAKTAAVYHNALGMSN